MALEDIEARAEEEDALANPPDRSVEVVEKEQVRSWTFKAKRFQVTMNRNQIDLFKLMDPVGKALRIAGLMRLRPKKELEEAEIFSVPEGEYDRDREYLVDAVSEW